MPIIAEGGMPTIARARIKAKPKNAQLIAHLLKGITPALFGAVLMWASFPCSAHSGYIAVRVGVEIDIRHAGSASASASRYVFDLIPAGKIGVTAHAMTVSAVPIPASAGPSGLAPATWSVNAVDTALGEFQVAWNAELRVSKSLLMGYFRCSPKTSKAKGFCGVNDWRTIGVRFSYVNGRHNLSGRMASRIAGS
jgi:hypothetical protein